MKKLLLITACIALGSAFNAYPVVCYIPQRDPNYNPETFRQIGKDVFGAAAEVFIRAAPFCAVLGAGYGGIRGAGFLLGLSAGVLGVTGGLIFTTEASYLAYKKTKVAVRKTRIKFDREYEPFKKRIGRNNFLRLGDNDFYIAPTKHASVNKTARA